MFKKGDKLTVCFESNEGTGGVVTYEVEILDVKTIQGKEYFKGMSTTSGKVQWYSSIKAKASSVRAQSFAV